MPYEIRKPAIHNQYIEGRGTKPNVLANGEYGSHAPTTIINNVVNVIGIDAMLPKNGTFRVLIICTINVCVNKDSTNQPV
jgi:hypothetical protein